MVTLKRFLTLTVQTFARTFGYVLLWYLKFDLGLTIAQHLVHFSLTVQSIERFDCHPTSRQKSFFSLFSYISTQSLHHHVSKDTNLCGYSPCDPVYIKVI